jgi:lauroyl/myristoyl acyltransferase
LTNPVAGTRVEIPARAPSKIASAWLAILFFLAARARWVVMVLTPFGVWCAVTFSEPTRRRITANAARIFGRQLTPAEARRFARRLIANFIDFVTDAGGSATMSAGELAGRINSVVGEPAFLEARRRYPNGAVMVTAHMGAFEVGLAALRTVEPNVTVVFKRDLFGGFESIRAKVRDVLGVREAAIDDGFATLVRLRDALTANEVVVMQADRAMPGQRSAVVPMLGGHVRVPTGPVKLAQMTGSPLVPVFVVRTTGRRYDVHLCEPIVIDPAAEEDADGVHPALRHVVRSIEQFVGRFPEQWLVLDYAFVEDEQRAH